MGLKDGVWKEAAFPAAPSIIHQQVLEQTVPHGSLQRNV
jgi:hypothetical protein